MNVNWAQLNACGPFPHSYYTIGGRKLSQEGPLSGRADFLVAEALTFLSSLSAHIGRDKRDLSILEIGSYDGWVSHQLFEHGYENIVTLEPRSHNIERGKRMRSLLGQSDGVLHLLGTLESQSLTAKNYLNGRVFDAVLSFGVIHHLDDPISFLRRVRELVRHSVLLECVTLSDELVTTSLTEAIEPKDIVYRNRPKEVSIYGVKMESNVLPGSRVGRGPVLIPGERALRWAIESAGFSVASFAKGSQLHERLEFTHRKTVRTSLVTANVSPSTNPSPDDSQVYEDLILSEEVYNCRLALTEQELKELSTVISTDADAYSPTLEGKLRQIADHSEHSELVMGLIHAPLTKLKFERAKERIASNSVSAAIEILREIVENPCDDWRTCYRSFFLLAEIDTGNSDKWRALCRYCNPEFPYLRIRRAQP